MIFKRNFDWLLFLVIILILSLGTITIFSVNPLVFQTHLIYVFIAIFVFFLFSSLDFLIFEKLATLFYFLSLFLLLIPPFFGIFSRGAVRWIQIGGVTFQPSEFAKPFLVIFSARFWLKKGFSFKRLIVYFSLIFVPFILIVLQPDLGSSLVILGLALGMILLTNINLKEILGSSFLFILLAPFGFMILKDYQKERIKHFLNPFADPLGAGYNIIQSIITVGSGGLFGKGFGAGTQSHLAFLPERHTDFIFASFAEEFGFLGSLLVVLLYFFLLQKILKIAKTSRDDFGSYLSYGILFIISFQTFVNIGMNIGILPITGVTLPLFSYGGSSLISTMICLGLIEGVSQLGYKSSSFEIN